MRHRFTRHALDRIAERSIPLQWIESVLAAEGAVDNPDAALTENPEYARRRVLQRRFQRDGKSVLLRIVVEADLVITAMQTSKLAKYGE